MKTWWIFYVVIAASCASKSDSADVPTAAASASFEVTFAGADRFTVTGNVSSSFTSSRFLARASSGEVTVFLSIPQPIQSGQLTVSESAQDASIWASRTTPLIAQQGTVTLEVLDGHVSVSIPDARKAEDTSGESVLIVGSFEGLLAP